MSANGWLPESLDLFALVEDLSLLCGLVVRTEGVKLPDVSVCGSVSLEPGLEVVPTLSLSDNSRAKLVLDVSDTLLFPGGVLLMPKACSTMSRRTLKHS